MDGKFITSPLLNNVSAPEKRAIGAYEDSVAKKPKIRAGVYQNSIEKDFSSMTRRSTSPPIKSYDDSDDNLIRSESNLRLSNKLSHNSLSFSFGIAGLNPSISVSLSPLFESFDSGSELYH
jgi:hypothetical protein